MHIALISPEHPSTAGGGGIGTYTMTMGAALAQLGHEVDILTRGQGRSWTEDGVRVSALSHRALPVALGTRLLAARGVARAARGAGAGVGQAAEWAGHAWWVRRRRAGARGARRA